MSEAEFRDLLLQRLRLDEGRVVFVHSSIDKMRIGFPFIRVLPILLEIVGRSGTLLFPCNSVSGGAREYLRREEIFDVRNDVTVMGLLPELARRSQGAIRSMHPINSVVAIGKHAKELVRDHSESIYPCGELSPYYKIVQYEGLIVGLGIGITDLSFVHCVEDIWQDRFPLMTRTEQIFHGRTRDWDGNLREVPTVAAHPRIRWRNVRRYVRKHVAPSICEEFTHRGAKWFWADSKKLYHRMEELTAQGVTIYTKRAWKE